MRYLRSYIIVSFLILVLIGYTYSALGQTVSIANHVVINEADINPVGDDSKYPIDWVELYNPTNSAVNIGGWTVGATTGLKQIYTMPSNAVLQSKQFLILTSGPLWFPHAGAVIQLKSNNGTLIDQTPSLSDFQGGGSSWQRMYDGDETGSSNDWVYKTATPGSSNGHLTTTTISSANTMTVASDKQSYIFDDTITISGTVSKFLNDPALGYPLSVNLIVSGPAGFQKTFTMYPDNNLKFSTTLKTSQVTGFSEGNYTISASYGTVTASTHFMLGATPFIPPTQAAALTMSVSTDQSIYTVLQPITLIGNASQVIPLTPVVYKVYEPNGTMIYQGNLYPDSHGHFTTYNSYQSHSSASGIMINNINPIYGKYTIVATYSTAKATTSFILASQQAQTTPLVVSTDKQVYGLGDIVHISGSTQLSGLQNSGLSPVLEIIQSSAASGIQGTVPQTLDIKTFVNVKSDNTFTYDFTIPSDSVRLGNYRTIVSILSTKVEADFVVASNPSTYQAAAQSGPFTMVTDKTSYAYGDPIIISGQIQTNMLNQGSQIQISVFNSTGGQLYSQTTFISGAAISQSTSLEFFAYPDASGNYLIKQTLTPSMFIKGTYTLKASYGSLRASTTFSVYNPLDTGSQGPILASLDKQVYGVGETVHLTGKLSSSVGTSIHTVTLLKPDGGLVTAILPLNNGLFSWNWTIPSKATFNTVSTFTTNRASSLNATSQTNLYGIYVMTINSDYGSTSLFFQVSPNPQNQTAVSPFAIETDKTSYLNSDVVNISGQTLPQSNTATQTSNTQAQISIYTQSGQEIERYAATLNQGGQFHMSIPLQPGVWPVGNYKIYAQYLTYTTQSTFQVTNPYTISSGQLQLFMITDHKQYLPGQTVLITGRTSYIISIDNAYLTFGLANDTVISEGQVMSQKGYTLQHAAARFDQYGSFSYDYTIPKTTSIGNYTVIAQVPFGSFNVYYQVVNQLPAENVPSEGNVTQSINATHVTPPANVTQTVPELTIIPTSIGPLHQIFAPSTIVDKEGMISDSLVTVNLNEKTTNNQTYYPREISGLLRVNPEDENSVSMKITSPDGTCVIGSTSDCLISQSTFQLDASYKNVNVGSKSYLVGYSGANQRIQQFSILPTNANDSIVVGQWHVDIIKNNQMSRFYYQVTYVAK
ncbi:MAG TPA: lamin tail domain-containing protein [Candidatus Nitrosotalea sp.]|nr:lamin tail domain-containing protein [Candidatus Nitrosotalea sp.]